MYYTDEKFQLENSSLSQPTIPAFNLSNEFIPMESWKWTWNGIKMTDNKPFAFKNRYFYIEFYYDIYKWTICTVLGTMHLAGKYA